MVRPDLLSFPLMTFHLFQGPIQDTAVFLILLFSCSVMSTLCDPMDCSMPSFSVLHHLPELAQTHVHWVGDAIQPSHPLLSPFSSHLLSFPTSGSFGISQLFTLDGQIIGALFSISPSNEYSGLLFFRIDRFYLIAVQGTLKSLLQHHSLKPWIIHTQLSLWSNSHILTWLYGPL